MYIYYTYIDILYYYKTKIFIKSMRVYEYMESVGHFNQIRKVQKQRLLDFIKEHKEMSIDKILGLFSLQTGMRVSTLRVYVDELRMAGVVE